MNSIMFNKKMMFENFVPGKTNELAYSVSVEVSKLSDEALYLVYILGTVGSGKTHLMMSIAEDLQKNNPNLNLKYVRANEFVDELIEAIVNRKTVDFRKEYKELDLLLFDNLEFLKGKESSQEELYYICDFLKLHNKKIIFASSKPINEIIANEGLLSFINNANEVLFKER